MTDQMVQTTPKPSAAFLAWGVALLLVGGALLGAAGVEALSWEPTWASDLSPAVPLTWVGVPVSLVGIALLVAGVYRIAQHADRAAGVRVPAGGADRGWHEEKVAAEAAEQRRQ